MASGSPAISAPSFGDLRRNPFVVALGVATLCVTLLGAAILSAMAAGRAGAPFDPHAVALWLGEHQLMAAGQPLAFDRAAASTYLRERASGTYLGGPGPGGDTVLIRLAVGRGPGAGVAWGCDLSDQYVRINADYTT